MILKSLPSPCEPNILLIKISPLPSPPLKFLPSPPNSRTKRTHNLSSPLFPGSRYPTFGVGHSRPLSGIDYLGSPIQSRIDWLQRHILQRLGVYSNFQVRSITYIVWISHFFFLPRDFAYYWIAFSYSCVSMNMLLTTVVVAIIV